MLCLMAVCVYRWQAHNSLLEEKRWLKHARYSQAQITSSLQTHRHQENRLQSLRRQIISHWGQRQVSTYTYLYSEHILTCLSVGSWELSWSKRWSKWSAWCNKRTNPPRNPRRARQRSKRSELPSKSSIRLVALLNLEFQ